MDPTASNTNDEYVAETFYRLQLTPFIQVTPAAMLVMNPSKNADNNPEGVFSLRERALF
ncbi:MAG: carbohydrate porin [Methyloceanibacter sp.]|uniref:carbohydrate porin n=1 Tax=Methyloceanibacter sp. TaxID=1965321 RepID=UPI003C57FF07